MEDADEMNLNPCKRDRTNCTIFLGYTSNMISSGVRDTIRFLVQNNMVNYDVLHISFLLSFARSNCTVFQDL